MANVLTTLSPKLFTAARDVQREMIGFLGAANLNFDDKGVAKGDQVTVPVIAQGATSSFSNSMTWSAGADRTPTTKNLTLNQAFQYTWNLGAEEERSLMNGGSNATDVFVQTVGQGLRTLANKIEAYAALIASQNASRAVGTAATTPFGTAAVLTDSANAAQVLIDNGAPKIDWSLVFNTAVGANIRGVQSSLFKVNEAGDGGAMLRRGVLGSVHGFDFRESGGIVLHTKGTGTSYTTDSAGYAIGATVITLITGSGTIVAGDVVTFAGDTNKYIVATGAAAAGPITLQEPGLRIAIAASPTAMTIGANYTPNIGLYRNALQVVARPALQPIAADVEQMVITDPVSGLSFLMIRKVGDGMASWYIRVVYDAFAVNPFGLVTLMG